MRRRCAGTCTQFQAVGNAWNSASDKAFTLNLLTPVPPVIRNDPEKEVSYSTEQKVRLCDHGTVQYIQRSTVFVLRSDNFDR